MTGLVAFGAGLVGGVALALGMLSRSLNCQHHGCRRIAGCRVAEVISAVLGVAAVVLVVRIWGV